MSALSNSCRQRNFQKYRIAGSLLPTYGQYTYTEALLVHDINDKIYLLLKEFDSNSRKLGYTVPQRRCSVPGFRCIVKYSIQVYAEEHYYCKSHYKLVQNTL